MPVHPRQKICSCVSDALTKRTPVNDTVFIAKHLPLFRDKLPCIVINTEEETSELYLESPRTLKRQVTLVITGLIEAVEDVTQQLDELALSIENVMEQDVTLQGSASNCLLISTNHTINTEGEKPIGSLQLHYQVTYYTQYQKDRLSAERLHVELMATNHEVTLNESDNIPL